MYAVCVNFILKPGNAQDFLPLVIENARVSKMSEPGCHQFDVAWNNNHPDAVFLYEIYEDRAAFDAHLDSQHFKIFDEAISDLVADKIVQTWGNVRQ
ncbi:MAG: putative quinol monooxygenase [Pseudomonadota bacterium]